MALDPMVGSGTTLVECKLLDRNAIGVDVNPLAIMVARDRLNFQLPHTAFPSIEPNIETYRGDARHPNRIADESIDLIATHPPYASIISYSKKNQIDGDLSMIRDLRVYVKEMRHVARECYRVMKPSKYCAVLVGDTRRRSHHVPLAFRVMQVFLEAGFIIREDIIKLQWNVGGTRNKWSAKDYDFLLLAHEHLFVFRKPEHAGELLVLKDSARWW